MSGSLDGWAGINDNLGVEGSAIVEEAGFGLLVELLLPLIWFVASVIICKQSFREFGALVNYHQPFYALLI